MFNLLVHLQSKKLVNIIILIISKIFEVFIVSKFFKFLHHLFKNSILNLYSELH